MFCSEYTNHTVIIDNEKKLQTRIYCRRDKNYYYGETLRFRTFKGKKGPRQIKDHHTYIFDLRII